MAVEIGEGWLLFKTTVVRGGINKPVTVLIYTGFWMQALVATLH